MKVTEKDVAYVADLANLELTPEESLRMVADLNSILGHIDKLNELDTRNVEPMTGVVSAIASADAASDPFAYAQRADQVTPGLSRKAALSNAPDTDGTCFKVPKVDRARNPEPGRQPMKPGSMNINTLTIDDARSMVESRRLSAVELAEAHFSEIASRDETIGSFLSLTRARALEQAKRIDALAEKGDPLPKLAGVPVAIKDVLMTRGERTTAASRLLEKFVAPYSATAVDRLESAGAVVLGKLNCDEFAMGSSNENSAYRPVRNPRDTTRVPGGSSGGSAAAVAAGFAVATLGSDTGGSIRQPAAFCGVVGLLPTYGRVSRYGLIAFASSLDHVGPLTRTVKDSATLLEVIAGRDPHDSTSADVPVAKYCSRMRTRGEGSAHRHSQGIFWRGTRSGDPPGHRAPH